MQLYLLIGSTKSFFLVCKPSWGDGSWTKAVFLLDNCSAYQSSTLQMAKLSPSFSLPLLLLWFYWWIKVFWSESSAGTRRRLLKNLFFKMKMAHPSWGNQHADIHKDDCSLLERYPREDSLSLLKEASPSGGWWETKKTDKNLMLTLLQLSSNPVYGFFGKMGMRATLGSDCRMIASENGYNFTSNKSSLTWLRWDRGCSRAWSWLLCFLLSIDPTWTCCKNVWQLHSLAAAAGWSKCLQPNDLCELIAKSALLIRS